MQRKEPWPSLGEGAIPVLQLYPNTVSGWELSVQGNAGAHLSPVHQGNLSITPALAGTLPLPPGSQHAPDCRILGKEHSPISQDNCCYHLLLNISFLSPEPLAIPCLFPITYQK